MFENYYFLATIVYERILKIWIFFNGWSDYAIIMYLIYNKFISQFCSFIWLYQNIFSHVWI